jgi:hypothetical protein
MQPLSCALLLFFVIRNREQYFVNFFSKYSRKALVASRNLLCEVRSIAKVQTPSTCRQTYTFPEISNKTFEERKSNNQLAEITVTPTVALQG